MRMQHWFGWRKDFGSFTTLMIFCGALIGNVCVSSASHLVFYLYRGVVVNKYGMNQPLTMALKAKSKDLKSCHFDNFLAILET